MATVIVNWGISSFEDITEIRVHRVLNESDTIGAGTVIASLPATATSYEDTISPVEQDTYYYTVEAIRPSSIIVTDKIPVLVVGAAIDKPVIASATFDSSSSVIAVLSSAFSANTLSETHESSEWEVWSGGRKKVVTSSVTDLESNSINIPASADEEWTYSEHSDRIRGLATDSDGYVYSAAYDGSVRKIDQFTNTIWTYTGTSYRFLSVAVDADGFVYTGNWEGEVVKIDPSGGLVWEYTGHTNFVTSVAVDPLGNVYSGSADNTIRKLDPDGTELWVFSGHTDNINKIVVDDSGNVYSASLDFTAKKINTSGVEQWTFSGHTNYVYGIDIDGSGNVYTSSWDNTVRKLFSDGTPIWTFSGFGGNIWDVVADDSGVYCAAEEDVIKISPDGTSILWTFSGFSINVYTLALDNDGNVYAGGGNDTIKKIAQPPEIGDLSVRVKYIGSTIESEWSELYVV